jgi:cyanophycinase
VRRALIAIVVLTLAVPAFAGKQFSYFRIGNTNDVTTSTTAGTVLMGGSTDVDAAFQWLCDRSGGGDFLVIRATGTDAYNPYVQDLCPGINSVATLIIPSVSAANDPVVAATIRSAEVLWIAGGDQSNYINFWKGTPVQAAVNELIARGVPVGGTSAGLNVLPQFIFAAQNGTETSSQALADCFDRRISLDRDFANIAILTGIIADPHFAARDRMGRLLVFMARIIQDGMAPSARGIAVDERTALLIDDRARGTVVGEGNVYFLQSTAAPAVCQPRTPVTFQNIAAYRINTSGSFNLSRWSGSGGTAYSLSATAAVLSSTQPGGSIY